MFNPITLQLNKESAAVLLRCLGYGKSAVSREEVQNGVAAVIDHNVELMRETVCRQLSESIIIETADRVRINKEAPDA